MLKGNIAAINKLGESDKHTDWMFNSPIYKLHLKRALKYVTVGDIIRLKLCVFDYIGFYFYDKRGTEISRYETE